MRVKWIAIVPLAIALGTQCLAAEELSQTEVLKDIEKKVSAVKSYTVTMKNLMRMPDKKDMSEEEKMIFGTLAKMSTKIWYKHPGKLRSELSGLPGVGKSVSIINGDVQWHIVGGPAGPMISRTDLKKLSGRMKGKRFFDSGTLDIAHPFTSTENFKLLGKVTEDKEEYYLFKARLLPAPGDEMGDQVKLRIRVKDGLLSRIDMSRADGQDAKWMGYEDLKLNVDIPDEKFNYTPPKGVTVHNMMDMFEEFEAPSGAREEAHGRGRRRADCLTNLNYIETACHLYAMDYDDLFPPDLSLLYPLYVPSLDNFVCPETKDRISSPERIETDGGYVYVKGLSESSQPGELLAYDKPGNHPGGRNVIHMHGRSKWEEKQ